MQWQFKSVEKAMTTGSPLARKPSAILIALWLLVVLAGALELNRYSHTPGAAAAASAQWPSASHLYRTQGKATLLLFAHPECSCSKASIGELERLLPFAKDRLTIDVVFIHPANQSVAWVQSSLWNQAKAIPGVNVMMDDDLVETDAFGAKTSGQTFLYTSDGLLVFAGGLTPERGHMGDSEGRHLVLDWLEEKNPPAKSTKVFGCALHEMHAVPTVQNLAEQQ